MLKMVLGLAGQNQGQVDLSIGGKIEAGISTRRSHVNISA